MFKENPLSVGTRLGYIFVLPASLYRSLSEVAFGNLESGKLRFGPYDTLAHTYRTISLASPPRRFPFASRPRIRAPARKRSSSSAVYVSFFLTARKIAASSKMLVAKSLLLALSRRKFQCISTFSRNTLCVQSPSSNQTLPLPFFSLSPHFLISFFSHLSLFFYVHLSFSFLSHRCCYGHSYLFSISGIRRLLHLLSFSRQSPRASPFPSFSFHLRFIPYEFRREVKSFNQRNRWCRVEPIKPSWSILRGLS